MVMLCLMKLEEHRPILQLTRNLDLPTRMGHAVFQALALTVLHGLCFLHNIVAPGKRNLEGAFDAGNRAALEYIVRNCAASRQPSKKRAQHGGIVIHTLEQHGLIFHYSATFTQYSQCGRRFLRQLSRMIELRDHIYLLPFPIGSQSLLKLRILRDPLRENYGYSRCNANKIQMLHLRKGGQIA